MAAGPRAGSSGGCVRDLGEGCSNVGRSGAGAGLVFVWFEARTSESVKSMRSAVGGMKGRTWAYLPDQ